MSFLIFVHRHQDIIRRKNELNMKLMNLNKKLMDLQSYTSSIADGTVSMRDLMSSPSTMFNRMSIFMQYSHQTAYQGAQSKIGPMMMMQQAQGGMANMDPAMQQEYAKMVFKNLYDQEREKASAVETKMLNKEDLKIQQEKAKIEDSLKLLDAEEEKVTAAEDKAAQKSSPQYVA